MKGKREIILLVSFLIGIMILTNPTREDYLQFSEESFGKPSQEVDQNIYIERINFLLFTTFTPVLHQEHGTTHLGIYGQFIQISDGQFDYPWWLKFFNSN
jgi:hypothetical protein